MEKRRNIQKLIPLLLVVFLLTSCDIPFLKDKKAEEEQKKAQVFQSTIGISPADDEAAKKVITEYFGKLYKENNVESYVTTGAKGLLPDNIKGYISKQTLDEGTGNPEIPVHLPRFVEMNGFTIIGYEPLLSHNTPQIATTFIEKANNNSLLYYTKINLKAKCVTNTVFDANYKLNTQSNVYEKVPGALLDNNAVSFTKIQATYDVQVIKDGNDFKVLSAREISNKVGYKNRFVKYNNEFITRIPYLNAESEEYKNEKAVIEKFFNGLLQFDKSRMDILTQKWNLSEGDFKKYFTKFVDTATVGTDYKTKFNITYLPLQLNMRNINKYNNIKVDVHPLYYEKNKKYIVNIDASVVTLSGIESVYKYEYFINLSNELKVNGIQLNEYYMVPQAVAPPPPSAQPTNGEESK